MNLMPGRTRLVGTAVALAAATLAGCATLEPPTYRVVSGAEGERHRCSKAEYARLPYGPVRMVVQPVRRPEGVRMSIGLSVQPGASVEPSGEAVAISTDGGRTVNRPPSLEAEVYENHALKRRLGPGSGLPPVRASGHVFVHALWPVDGAEPREIEVTPPALRVDGETVRPPKLVFRLSDGHAVVPLCIASGGIEAG